MRINRVNAGAGSSLCTVCRHENKNRTKNFIFFDRFAPLSFFINKNVFLSEGFKQLGFVKKEPVQFFRPKP